MKLQKTKGDLFMENFRDILQVEGVKAKGYGIIPKMVMLDRKLTIEAKAIYSYFCSYAGAGTTAFPSREKICEDLSISVKRYYSHFNLLKNLGYIKVSQAKSENNKFSYNIYTLVENPTIDPCTQNDYTDEKPCSRFGNTQIRNTQNDHANNNKSFIKNNKSLYNNQSVSQEENRKQTDRQTPQLELENVREEILAAAEIELYNGQARELLENTIDALLVSKEVNINNRKVSQQELITLLNKINLQSCDYALNKFSEVQKEKIIKNKFKYFSSILLSAINEVSAYELN